ncbi:MAG: hypothetical protein ACJ8EY_05905 [Sphingomicrobium sp.]
MKISHALALISLVSATTVTAQPLGNLMMPAPAPKAGAAAAVAGGTATLRAGTAVPVKLPDSFNGKASVGQRLQLSVASEVLAGSKVAIPAGAWAEGQVTEIRDGGAAGKMAVKLLTVRGSKGPLKLTASFNSNGVKAFLDEDLKVAQ